MISKFTTIRKVYAETGIFPALGLISEYIVSKNVYMEYLRLTSNDEGLVKRSLPQFDIYLDPCDSGISHKLLHNNTHEGEITQKFEQELEKFGGDGHHILEIGANKGYFAFIEKNSLPSATIHAIEPHPINFKALKNGIFENEFNNINCYQIAMGSSQGKTDLHVSFYSNRHTTFDYPSEKSEIYSSRSIQVEVDTVDDFIDEKEIEPSNIVCIRCDIEGAEYDVLTNSESVIKNARDLLIFIEFHPHRLGVSKTIKLVEYLSQNDFDLVLATSRVQDRITSLHHLKSHLEGGKSENAAEAIFRRASIE